MFNSRLKKELSVVKSAHNNLALELNQQKKRISDDRSVQDRRYEYHLGEQKRTDRVIEEARLDVPVPATIGLSHVDAPNIKVQYDVADVVQALADHFGLGFLPEEAAQIVVLKPVE